MDGGDFALAFVWGFIFIAAPALVGKYAGHISSVVILVCLVIALSCLFVLIMKRRHRSESFRFYRREMLFVGLIWLFMNVIYEVIRQAVSKAGTAGLSWAEYNAFEGGLMGLVWLTELVAPYVFGIILLRHHRYRRRS